MNKTKRMIAGWEIDFENPDKLKKTLLTQGIDKAGFDFFKTAQTATEIVIKQETIVKVVQRSLTEKKSKKANVPLPILDWPDRELFFFVKDPDGNHKLGGNPPSDFKFPFHENLKTPFIYIGSIDISDEKFEWINLPSLDLAYPIYECNFGIFMDYSNPKKPEILNPDTFDDAWFEDSMKGIDKVCFNEQRYSVTNRLDLQSYDKDQDNILLGGVPLWCHVPDIPICPKTGEIMRFVCSIKSDDTIRLKNCNDFKNLPFGKYLVFGDHGHLFVFYHPVSKVLYMNIQFNH